MLICIYLPSKWLFSPICNKKIGELLTFSEAKADGVGNVLEDDVDQFPAIVARGVGRHAVFSPLVRRKSRVSTDWRIHAVFLPVARLVHQYFHRYARFVRTDRVIGADYARTLICRSDPSNLEQRAGGEVWWCELRRSAIMDGRGSQTQT